jgi:hypothetical protein
MNDLELTLFECPDLVGLIEALQYDVNWRHGRSLV